MEVETLPVEQPVHAKALLDIGKCLRLNLRRGAGDCPPNQRVGAIDKGQRGKDCPCFAICEMYAGNSAPLGGIVHARQIVEQ